MAMATAAKAATTPSFPPPSTRRLAIVTGGSRGIGRGIVQRLVESSEYTAIIVTYNNNHAAAQELKESIMTLSAAQSSRDGSEGDDEASAAGSFCRIHLVQGDLSLESTRDKIFDTVDQECSDCQLCTVVHNAGLYVGITSDTSSVLEEDATNFRLVFGDGSLLKEQEDGTKKLQLDTMHYYQRLYGDAFVDLCERSLERIRSYGDAFHQGSLIGISSPGCNLMARPNLSYSMPGSGKCIMEHTMRLFARAAAPLSVNCNVIIPGVTRTEAWEKLAKSRGQDKLSIMNRVADMVPMKKNPVVDPLDIGDAVVFLSKSSGSGRLITGVSLPVDGGFHLK